MERQMWADFKAKEWKVVESKIAEGFQSIHPDGPRDRVGEISLIEHLNLGEFTLSNFKSTVNGGQHRGHLHDRGAGDDRPKTIAGQANSALERVEERNARLAMDLPRQS